MTSHNFQNTTQKTKDWAPRTWLETVSEFGVPEIWNVIEIPIGDYMPYLLHIIIILFSSIDINPLHTKSSKPQKEVCSTCLIIKQDLMK